MSGEGTRICDAVADRRGRLPFALVGGVCYDLVTELRAEAGRVQIIVLDARLLNKQKAKVNLASRVLLGSSSELPLDYVVAIMCSARSVSHALGFSY